MKTVNKVKASSQVDATLPLWIRSPDVIYEGTTLNSYSQESHRNFVTFMTTTGESQERVGFGQDLLQNLLNYRTLNGSCMEWCLLHLLASHQQSPARHSEAQDDHI